MDCCVPSFEHLTGEVRTSSTTEVPVAAPQADPTANVVALEGEFLMGTRSTERQRRDGEDPVRKITLSPFYIEKTSVTNKQFAEFVDTTGYVTEAEQFGWSFVFHQFVSDEVAGTVDQAVTEVPWWWKVDGSYWRHPEGPGSSMDDRLDHPVVHASWNDAVAFATWSGKRLPTEAEWEFAARGGLEQAIYPWGDELTPGGQHMCNVWQGDFPDVNTVEDGHAGTAPVTAFEPNGYGLYNVSGNVWEWCADWFSRRHHVGGPRGNPKGPSVGQSKIAKGGSYLCHKSYCNRYRPSARTASTPDSSTGHMGFRLAMDAA
jgi:formylglycine-generating enzyme required for sulfatase activity